MDSSGIGSKKNDSRVEMRALGPLGRQSLDHKMCSQAHADRLGSKLHMEAKRERRHSESASIRRTSISGKGQLSDHSLLPKFGDWNVNDPSCGVEYTAVFERAADEKKMGGLSTISPKPSSFVPPAKLGGSSSKKQFYCCCYPTRQGTYDN